jgi:hypothetical protein
MNGLMPVTYGPTHLQQDTPNRADEHRYVWYKFPDELAERADADDFYFSIDTEALDQSLKETVRHLQ